MNAANPSAAIPIPDLIGDQSGLPQTRHCAAGYVLGVMLPSYPLISKMAAAFSMNFSVEAITAFDPD
jgi:hypothetical protein